MWKFGLEHLGTPATHGSVQYDVGRIDPAQRCDEHQVKSQECQQLNHQHANMNNHDCTITCYRLQSIWAGNNAQMWSEGGERIRSHFRCGSG